jgi:hypothetical protein
MIGLVDLNSVSWNRLTHWLRAVSALAGTKGHKIVGYQIV